MEISCSFYSSPQTPDHIELAERLGYHRAWCYDSPVICTDVWMTLARAADRTERIGLAPGVLVPPLRHVMTTAAAVATLEMLAPGRVALATGAGFTAARMLGQRPMRWADVEAYVRALRGLLRGEEVEWDGAVIRMAHPEGISPPLPIEVPVAIGAEGPRGLACARRLGTGISTGLVDPPAGFDWSIRLVFGTVLDEGEAPTSERVYEAAGPAAALAYHALYEFGDLEALSDLPNGDAWLKRIQAVPERVRHLTVHEGHAYAVNDLDREMMPAELVPALTLTGTARELRARLDGLAAAGVTELTYQPAGPDIARELETFAAMAIR